MSFSCQKGEFDRFFNRLDRPVEESRPDRPVDPTGAGRPDRFPSLIHTLRCSCNQPIIGRVDRASAAETVDSDSIPVRVKPRSIKTGIHSFPA